MPWSGNYQSFPEAIPVSAELQTDEHGLIIQLPTQKLVWEFSLVHKKILRKGRHFELRYAAGSEILWVEKDVISHLKKQHPHWGFSVYRKGLLPDLGAKAILLGTLFFVGFLALGYFIILPWVAKQAATLIPIETEVKLGNQLLEQVIGKGKEDTAKSRLIQSFFQSTTFQSPFPVQVHVVNEEIVNAFAIPGGHIVVYQGILKKMSHYSQLAGLLAHEVSHTNGRHSARSLLRMAGTAILFSMLFGDITGLAAIMAENAESLRSLQYSRALEYEADKNGYDQLKSAKISPNGMIQLFDMLGKESSSNHIPAFLQTHPQIEDRIMKIKETIKSDPFKDVNHPALSKLFQELKS